MFTYRDERLAREILAKLKALKLNLRLMHVCGTHQDTLVRFGLDSLLRDAGIEIRAGPGCPVCVTTAREIEEAIALARAGNVIATFGDMFRVPGEEQSLADVKAEGQDIRMVYSITDCIALAQRTDKDVIFFSIGFETTAPAPASVILSNPPENFSILSAHRLIPPALDALLQMGELRIDGFIDPGHVSAIIGTTPYEFLSSRYNIPQVIAGFEPLDLLVATSMLAKQKQRGEAKVENEYARVVKRDGNEKAKQILATVFEPCDVGWRGFPLIAGSGLALRPEFEQYDARKQYEDELRSLSSEYQEPEGCRCGEILRGIVEPAECPLFGTVCTPRHPIGPCMVSHEGSCNIIFRYGRPVPEKP
ncbi:MAG TPA: hydrogenase formation protein HypD [Methanomicrobia archaeon]|nr:hydrogenase formation protein HypD [Methanomicrobia archaeon]